MRPARPAVAPLRRRTAARALAVAAALTGVSILVAGCGAGASSPGVASVTTAKASTSQSPNADGEGGGDGSALGGRGQPSGAGGSSRGSGVAFRIGDVEQALRFSECMRANGAPSFPDPNGEGVIETGGIDLSSALFQKASQTCVKYRAAGAGSSPGEKGQFVSDELAFSRCIRSHGVPDFPDPQVKSFGNAVRISVAASDGVDTSSPIYEHAEKQCASTLPGGATTSPAAKH